MRDLRLVIGAKGEVSPTAAVCSCLASD